MTEREKMITGKAYDSRDPELLEMYWRCREILSEFGRKADQRDRMSILRRLIPELPPTAWIEAPVFFEYGVHVRIGPGSYVNVNCFFQDCAPITIGANTLIGPGVQFCTATHPVESEERIPGGRNYVTSAHPISVGDRVWIGANVTILGGVTLGDDSVIGAGSVVSKSIPSGVVAYGIPCRIRRTLGDPNVFGK